MHTSARYTRHGFTLIEMSIVLVIIGLLVGGILGGQVLVKAAKIRSFISQIDGFKMAVGTFEAKYGNMPGDITPIQASQFSFAARAGGVGHGNGDGFLSADAYISSSSISGEVALFWNDLSAVTLIPGRYVGTDCDGATGNCPTTGNTSDPDYLLPKPKLEKNTYVSVYYDYATNLNYYQVIALPSGGPGILDANGRLAGADYKAFTPYETYEIDAKMDDGAPYTGLVTVRGADNYAPPAVPQTSIPALLGTGVPGLGVCILASGLYNVAPATGGNALACSPTLAFN